MIEIFIITIPVGSSFPSDKREKKKKKSRYSKKKKRMFFLEIINL